jgi:DEAD/DEAH box helicase domain-containing protein
MGRRLNAAMFSAPQVSDLACEMEEADVPFAYGLRGTLPGISLLGGGGGSPFYILSKVHDEKLAPSSSPFEMAEAQMGYTQFLYTKREWNVDVDWVRTLAASRAMFYLLNGEWRVETGYGIAKTYILALDFVRKAIGNFQGDLSKMQQQLAEVKNPHIQAILRLGRALRLYNAHYADFVLGQGDVFLKRLAREDKSSKLVRDQWGNPLVLSDQLWLYLGGNINRVWQTMREKELDALSEVRYPHLEQNPILLDEVAGGCFYIYERLVSDAD